MIFSGAKNIKILEFTKSSVLSLKSPLIPIVKQPGQILNFTSLKLSVALARTGCSKILDRKEYWIEIASQFLNLMLTIHPGNGNIRLNSGRMDRLRDFSKTNKIGELGQALIWLHLMNEGYLFISDFSFFCLNNKIRIPSKTKTPDFLAQTKNMSPDICLAESKAKLFDSSTTVKTILKKAIKQCISGETILMKSSAFSVKKMLAFCTEFSTELNQYDSIVNFTDPESNLNSNEIDERPMKFHYASWFYLVGDFKNVEKLLKGESVFVDDRYYSLEEIDGVSYWTIQLFNRRILQNLRFDEKDTFFKDFLLWEFDRYGFGIKLGIARTVVNYLDNTKFDMLESFRSESSDNLEFFADGTFAQRYSF